MKLIILIILLVNPIFLSAQDIWERIYGGAAAEDVEVVINTNDGNLLIGGRSESFNSDGSWAYLNKIDLSGNLIWQNTYKIGSGLNLIRDVIEIPNGDGFFAVGQTWNNSCASSATLLLRVNNFGDTLWTKPLCTDNSGYGYSIDRTSDGNFIVSNATNVGGSYEFQMMKIDHNGNELWSKVYFSPYWDYSYKAIETQDEGILLVGYISTAINGPSNVYLIKTDENGNELWNLEFGGSDSESARDVLELDDGDFLISGSKHEEQGSSQDAFLARVDSQGNLLWVKDFGAENLYDYPAKVRSTSDGGCVLAFQARVSGTSINTDYKLIKLDSSFNTQWEKTFGGDEQEELEGVTQTLDGGYCLVGRGRSFGDSNGDIYVVKTDSLGNSSRNLLKGTVFFDTDNSCTIDTLNELTLPNIIVHINGNDTITRMSNEEGIYTSILDTGTYEINPIINNIGPYFEFCNFPQTINLPNLIDTTCLDIPIQAAVECPYLSVDITTPFIRRCFENTIYVSYCNYGTIAALTPTVQVTLDSFFIYNSSTANLISQNGNIYNFELPSIEVWECGSFEINATLSCDAILGGFHCVEAHIFPDSLCNTTADSLFISRECRNNIGAFDPNDKNGFPKGIGPENLIEKETEIKYQIRFQNTGTDTAFNIVILDTLSSNLNINSMRMGASSHPYEFELLNNKICKWTFPNILLVDSLTNENDSKGFLNYFISPKEELSIGTSIYNHAGIYFDFNEPIITNFTTHKIGDLSTTVEAIQPKNNLGFDCILYPNPANEYFELKILNTAISSGIVSIYDINQRIVHSTTYNNNLIFINSKGFSNGVYFVMIKNQNGETIFKKVVIQK